jgi:hypothetical protein
MPVGTFVACVCEDVIFIECPRFHRIQIRDARARACAASLEGDKWLESLVSGEAAAADAHGRVQELAQ